MDAKVFAAGAAVVVVGLCVPVAFATIKIPTVTVGDANNAADTRVMTLDGTSGYGSVAYTYNIGTTEVTASQYAAFLNAVAGTDSNKLYTANMARTDYGSGITRSGSNGNYTYSVDQAFVNRPVNYVSYWNAVRFANWLHNGQPTGLQTAATTEDGAYTLTPGGMSNNTVARNANWQWAVTSENEWYKAAFYKGGSSSAGYTLFATASDAAPGRDMADPSGNNANFSGQGSYPIDSPYYTTVAGEFENTKGAYGTFDMGGNVREWNDSVVSGTFRGIRGGSYNLQVTSLRADSRERYTPTLETNGNGFRVVQAPTPTGAAVFGAAAMAGALRRRRSIVP